MLRDAPEVQDSYELALRRSALSPNTVQTYLKHFRTAIMWGVEKGYLSETPKKFRLPGTGDEMKGRPLNDEEFQAILAAVPEVVGAELASDWNLHLNGLWLSGLRRQESLNLSWDECPPNSRC